MPTTSTASSPDFAQQLYEALATTRSSVLDRFNAAGADTTTAVGAYNVSRHTFADARLSLDNAADGHRVASYLDRQLVNASLTAANAVALATNSNTRAVAATTAMATAAGNIKAAANSVDTLTNTINGVAGVTKSNDLDEPVDTAARAAVEAVAKVAHAVEILQSMSLAANVEASRTQTAAALQAVTASQGAVGGILTTANNALAASQAALEAAQTARATDLSDLFDKNAQFTVAAREQAGLAAALGVIDRVGNCSLRVRVSNVTVSRDNPDHIVAGLEASCELSAALAADTAEVRFFAVPADHAASFDFQTARRAHHASCIVRPQKKGARKPVTCTAQLEKDTARDHLRFGESYVVFFLRVPARAGHAAPSELRATDFSFPTPPITATVPLTFPTAPVIFPLLNGAFLTVFQGVKEEAYASAYQVFHSPADTYKLSGADELVVANNLTAANYISVAAGTHACKNPAKVTQSIERQFHKDMKVHAHVDRQALHAKLAPFTAWIRKHARGNRHAYVVYTNPFATKAGWKAGGFTIGRYADMYGDVFTLDRRDYVALALAVGSFDRKLLQQAANTLSPASNPFPAEAKSTAG